VNLLNKYLKKVRKDQHYNHLQKSAYLYILLIISAITLPAQTNAPDFRHITEELTNKFVRCILKDSMGFMWFGTFNGLNRFDGMNMIHYEHSPDDNSTISHNVINSIAPDPYGNLWIATAEGLNRYVSEYDRFLNKTDLPRPLNQLSNSYLSSLVIDTRGTIWIGTLGNGLYAFNIKTGSYQHIVFAGSENDASDYILCLMEKDDNALWIGSRQGLYLYNKKKQTWRTLSDDDPDQARLRREQVRCMTHDNTGALWAGTTGGRLYKITCREDKIEAEHYPMDPVPGSGILNSILSVNCDRDDKLYIGKENGGLTILDLNTRLSANCFNDEGDPGSISSNSVWVVYPDNIGKIWIGTYDKGISLIDKYYKKFESFQKSMRAGNGLIDNNVTAFAMVGGNDIWIGTDGGGVCIFDSRTETFREILKTTSRLKLSSNTVKCILQDRDGNIWIGYWAGGIDRINKEQTQVMNFRSGSGGADDNNILSLFEDHSGNIWAGSAGSGLFRFNNKRNIFVPASDMEEGIEVSKNAYVMSIYEDRDSTLWVASLYGLYALRRLTAPQEKYSTLSYYRNEQQGSISSNQIQVIFEDSYRTLWFGSNDNGLNRFDKENQTFSVFQKKDGLASNSVNGILEDTNGFLWISSNRGITKFKPYTGPSQIFTLHDGLVSDNFTLGAFLAVPGTRFYFGSDNGFNIIRTDSILVNPVKPVIYFTNLIINNKAVTPSTENSPLRKVIRETRNIILDHTQTSITIEYAGVSYTRPAQNQYAYQLMGFDNGWNYVGNQTYATYTNLDPGEYTLQVKGANNDGVWNEIFAELHILVKPSVWRTWWAIMLYILALSFGLMQLIRIRLERINIKNSLEVERIAREKDHELYQEKLRFFTNISHDFRTPLSLIAGPTESLMNSPELSTRAASLIQIIHKNSNRLLQLVNELMDFRKLENQKLKLLVKPTNINDFILSVTEYFNELASKRNIHFLTETDAHTGTGWLDNDKLTKILNNIISNAFRFTPDGGVIKVKTEKILAPNKQGQGSQLTEILKNRYYLKIKITDSGTGIDPADMPRIFERFYQSKLSEGQGTGIGLSLVKSLVELHHGHIAAESRPLKGSCFTITLPLEKESYAEEELDDLVSAKSEEPDNIQPYPADVHVEFTPEHSTLEKPSLLIVENNDDLRFFLAHELKDLYRISMAEDGIRGLQTARTEIPDLILSDIMMPKMNGVDMCHAIKRDRSTSHIPVILLTAKTSVDDQIQGVKEGADVYITKPFNIRFLIAQINHLITSRKEMYQQFSQEVHIIPSMYAKNKLDQDFLDSIITYILNHLADSKLGVESLAISVNLSRSQVYKKIKALTGKTAVEFIRDIRLKEAVKLMASYKYSLAEIAYKTGFTSPSYFTRSFKQKYGKAPSDFMTE
jgi:signal transduction histidine kinase/ligand-binding sensor domain-containing protein/DNA-binding response OmpR family regulator